jgi:hypothetical protein
VKINQQPDPKKMETVTNSLIQNNGNSNQQPDPKNGNSNQQSDPK